MTGTIQGGWEFVIAAYAATAVALGAYAAAVFLRLRREQRRAQGEAVEEPPR
ncbi:MAG: hypothetical protein NVS2B9_04150 [Myxococcales bacterium]